MRTNPSFTATVSAITDAFGDPTRRSIYLYAKERALAGEPVAGVTAAMVAAEVGVHANVARHHLDKLAAGGYLEVVSGRVAGAGAGRPSKRYVAVGDGGSIDDVPARVDDLLLSLLGRALDRLPHDEAETIAEEVGWEYGRAMAEGLTGNGLATGRRSLRSAMQYVADALTAHGFAAHAERRSGRLRIVNGHCPFGHVAFDHPVICAVDRGMVKGMLDALVDGDGHTGIDVVSESSVARGDTVCSTSI